MAFEHGDPMRKALAARRGKGIDISILVGPHDEAKDDKKTDLAPPPAHDDAAQDKALIDHELAQHDAAMGHGAPEHDVGPVDELHDGDILKGMSEHDMHDMQGRAPRSLGERARQAAMARGKK